MNGWIKVHRKMLDNPVVMKDPEHLAVWMYLLLEATHDDYPTFWGSKKVVLKPGQVIKGRLQIARDLNINESKVKRILNNLKNDQQIDQQAERYGSLITILNWDRYQNCDQQVTNECPTSDQRVTSKQEHKNKRNNNNVQNEHEKEFAELWDLYPKKSGRKDALRHYKAARKRGTTFDQVKAGIIAYKNYIEKTGTEQQYVKMGSSFFNQEAWENDWTVPAKPKSKVNAPPEPPKYKTFEPEPERKPVPMSPEQRKARDEILRGLSEAFKEA